MLKREIAQQDAAMAEGKTGGAGLFAKRVQKQFSRAQEKVLQKLGKTVETKDEQFEQSAYNFQQQQVEGHKLYKELKVFLNAVKVMHESSKKVSETLQEIYSEDWEGCEDLRAIVESNDLLWEDYEEKLADQAVRTMENYLTQFSEIKERIAKRGRKLVDYDSSRHHLEALQNAKKKDEAKIAKAEEEFYKAQAVFEEINKELREELPVIYNSLLVTGNKKYYGSSGWKSSIMRCMCCSSSGLNHDLYDVMSKLEKQHSNKVFIIKGVSSNRGSLVISSPISPTSPTSIPVGNSIRETVTSPSASTPNQKRESVPETEAVGSMSGGASGTEEEVSASLASEMQNEAVEVAGSDTSTVSDLIDDSQMMELETSIQGTPQKVEEVANDIARRILSKAVLEAAGKGQNVCKDSEDSAQPLLVNDSEASDSCEKDRGSQPQQKDKIPSPLKQEAKTLQNAQDETQVEGSNAQGDSLVSSKSSVCPEDNSQNSLSPTQDEVKGRAPGTTITALPYSCNTCDVPETEAIQQHQPGTGEASDQEDCKDDEADDSSDGSMEETEVSPQVTNTQTVSSFFSDDKKEDYTKLPLGFLFKAQAIQAYASEDETHLQFGEGETILVLSDVHAEEKGFLVGIKESDWMANQNMLQKGIFSSSYIKSPTLE
ncbi:hypothetical protein JD844_010923 [Phrynosoma platyrhinos]|uniref:Bridging integrator 2 n=1 Tax=Phrynosoma platyrhinos TaxID=52577 RepID=A0ABQ7THJ7_PHRPL|nr:hypothetical protein JD844_010923 [Phrynosoma platyrhinos]